MPRPAPLYPVVEEEQISPLTGQELPENDFIHVRPVPPEIKVSTLKSCMFYLPDAKIFLDKILPDPAPCFIQRITPHESYTPDYFTALHSLVFTPGHN